MDIRTVGNSTHPAPTPVDIKTADVAHSLTSGAAPILAEAVTPAAESQPTPTLAQITQAINSINQAMQAMSPDLQFSVDEDSNRTIVKIVDQKTKEVLRQIPTVEALAIAKALDQAQGLLIKQKA